MTRTAEILANLPVADMPDIYVANSVSIIAAFRFWSEADDFAHRYTTQNPKIVLTVFGETKGGGIVQQWRDGICKTVHE